MCQLFYCYYPEIQIFKEIISQIASIISIDGHHLDGTGLLNDDGKFWKTEKGAGYITNLQSIFNNVFTAKTSFAIHVRKASPGIEITEENAHPFSGENYILMHNGRLHSILIKEKESDSQRFLLELDKSTEEPPKAIKDTYEKSFLGKFAFIVFNKVKKKFYIVRGKTAKLNIVKFKLHNKDGYFVVTEPTSANFLIALLSNYFNNAIEFYNENNFFVSELNEETIYECGKKLVEVEKIKEKSELTPKTYYYDTKPYQQIFHNQEPKLIKLITSFIEKTGFLFEEVVYFIEEAFQCSLTEIEDDDEDILELLFLGNFSIPKKKRKEIAKLLKEKATAEKLEELYKDLPYPYITQTEQQLDVFISRLRAL